MSTEGEYNPWWSWDAEIDETRAVAMYWNEETRGVFIMWANNFHLTEVRLSTEAASITCHLLSVLLDRAASQSAQRTALRAGVGE